jgi:NAD+ synthase (glutamine-hydrolysing)
LEPLTDGQASQEDEKDMGLTYAEITTFGRLRKEKMLGAYGMFKRLVHEWGPDRVREADDDAPVYTPQEVAEKVKRFFHRYSVNRHKATTLTPAILTNAYSPDDNRFDLRSFLLPSVWNSWGFKKIDAHLARIEKARQTR